MKNEELKSINNAYDGLWSGLTFSDIVRSKRTAKKILVNRRNKVNKAMKKRNKKWVKI